MPYAKKRRTGAVAAEHQRIVASLKRTVLVMLPAWLAYFFALSLFGRSLNSVTVPYVNTPLGTNLVILGCALAFPMLVVLMMRAYATSRGA
jgi:hypothetical protein